MYRATTRPPLAAAWSLERSWRSYSSGAARFTNGVFQFTTRLAAADMALISSTSSSEKPTRNEPGMNSIEVPGWRPHTAASATSSSWVA
jgi:hypothetical protein